MYVSFYDSPLKYKYPILPKLLSARNLLFAQASSLCTRVVDDMKNLNGFALMRKSHYSLRTYVPLFIAYVNYIMIVSNVQ